MSSKSKKKKTAKYSQESVELALKEIRQDKKRIRETCRKYNIPRTTIQDRLSGKRLDEIKNRGPEPILGHSGEKQVVEWLLNITKCGFPVKKPELLDTAQKILKDTGKPNPFKNDRPGQSWYLCFLKRNPEISVRSTRSRVTVTEQSIRQWFQGLESFLSESGHLDILEHPERIFNGAETGFPICPETEKVIDPKSVHKDTTVQEENEKDNLTVFVTLNASGLKCPPVVVFPYLTPLDAITDSIPPDWKLGRSESGWMTREIFQEYLLNDFNTWIEQNNIQKPILLLLDGDKTHMSLELSAKCEEREIILYALPPDAAHNTLQPAVVSVFAALKSQWEIVVENFLSKSEPPNFTVSETIFCQLFKDVLDDPQMPINIVNGFRSCGLFPFGPDGIESVDYTKLDKPPLQTPNQPQNDTKSGISTKDLASTEKVILYLEPILQKKDIDVELILEEVTKLRETADLSESESD